MKKTLEEILKATANAGNGGMFGLDACKESIKDEIEIRRLHGQNADKTDAQLLFELLCKYTERAQTEVLFNDNMVQACWQLINEKV